VTEDQRAEWRRAMTAKAKAARNQRSRRKRGLATVTRAGMVRVNPTQPEETSMTSTTAENWTDPQATLGGAVAATSKCACGFDAITVVRSPRWGAWDVCEPCGNEQLAVLRGGDISKMIRPDLIRAEALRCIQLDRMLRA
jgi:hypothetical protein